MSIKDNIWKLYVIRAVSGTTFFFAMDKVFMELRGLSVQEIILIGIIYSITVLFLEVPSGALADRWSRKNVLTLNLLFFIANVLVWLYAHDFSIFVLGVIFGSIHSALLSGTHTSILFDTLNEINQEKEAKKILTNNWYYHGLFAVLAGLIGGLVAKYFGLEIDFWLTIISSVIGIVLCLTLVEPKIHRTTDEVNYWQHIIQASKHALNNKELWPVIFVTTSFLISFHFIDHYGQLYFYDLKTSIIGLGLLGSIFYSLEMIGSWLAGKFTRIQHKNLYLILFLLSITGYLGMYLMQNTFGIIFSLLPIFSAFISYAPLSTDLHEKLPSSYRATIDSVVSLVTSLIIIPTGLLFGNIADQYTVPLAFLYVGIGMILITFFYLTTSYKKI